MYKYTIYFVILLLFLAACNDNPTSDEDITTEENEQINFEKKLIKANVNGVLTVAISRNGDHIAWGGKKHEIVVHGNSILKGHIGSIFSLDFSNDDQFLLSGSRDHNVKIWNINSGELVKTFSQHLTETRDVQFTPDGESVISAEGNHIVYWRNVVIGNTGKQLFLGHTDRINSIDIDSNNELIISGSSDHTIKVWEIESGNLLTTVEAHQGKVLSVDFNPSNIHFASCSNDSSIIIWDINSFQKVKVLVGLEGIPLTIKYHPSGDFLVCGSSDSKLYIWDMENFLLIKILEGHTSAITNIDFNGDGSKLISGSTNDNIIVWQNFFIEE